jgi:uncharacterized protein (DUF934 family)
MAPSRNSPVPPERVIRCPLPAGVGNSARVAPEHWRFLGLSGAQDLERPLPPGPAVVPLAYWLAHRRALAARRDPVGVWLDPADEPAALAPDLASLPLVAVRFPKLTDGRGYSTAVLLRTRYGYRGELRAIGDVGRDQLFSLKRCGFDSFALAAHHDAEAAHAGLEVFRHRYQGSVDDPLPLFRRRHGPQPPRAADSALL